jgi:hypothetical protein
VSLPAYLKKGAFMTEPTSADENQRRQNDYRQETLRSFPFELIETSGDLALSRWEELKCSERIIPVVLGGNEHLEAVAEPFHPKYPRQRTVAEILESADRLTHPQDLARKRRVEEREAGEFLKRYAQEHSDPTVDPGRHLEGNRNREQEDSILAILQGFKPDIGEWPQHVSPAPGLTLAYDLQTGQALEKVYLALIPSDEWATIPAHLLWGGWNACPHPEYHIAAFRSWRRRFDIELIGIGRDTLNLKVGRRPATRDAAIELAREQYIYCDDIVDQGVGSLEALAASLMEAGWWFFWWD